MPKPELYSLSIIEWQLFCTLTFKKEEMPDSVRIRMFFAWLRIQSGWFGRHFKKLIWCLRQELGEATGRKHFHALIAGLPPHSIHETTCFSIKNLWESKEIGGGMARVSVYSRSLAGADYILKGLDAVQSRYAGDFYELTKFGGSCDVMLSESTLRVIQGRRSIGRRRQASTEKSGVIQSPCGVSLKPGMVLHTSLPAVG